MKSRRGEVATILTIATLVVIGVTAIVSSFSLNKKQTTSSKAACSSHMCSGGGGTCVDVGTISSGYKCCDVGKNPSHPTWTYASFSPTSVGCVGDILCKQKSCDSPNGAKKYYQKEGTTSVNYSDVDCGVRITKALTDYCKETSGVNVTPAPGQNPPAWGTDKGKGCGTGENGDPNYQFGACYQGRRCVQCQNVGVWYSYNCFETDSSCTNDQVYCPSGWPKTQCANGEHKCCNDTVCLPGNTVDGTPTTTKDACESSESQCNAARNEYCSEENDVCEDGDSLLSTVCGQQKKHCCEKTISATSCETTGNPKNIPRDGKKHCISESATGVAESTVICIEGNEFAVEFGCPGNTSTYTGSCISVSGGDAYCQRTSEIANTCINTGYGCIDKSTMGATDNAKCLTETYDRVETAYSCGDTTKVCCYKNPAVVQTICDIGLNFYCDAVEGICRASSQVGNNAKSYYVTTASIRYAKKDGANCVDQTAEQIKTWCECKAPEAAQGAVSAPTGCMTQSQCASNPSCGSCSANPNCPMDDGNNPGWLCTPKVSPAVEEPAPVSNDPTIVFKNSCGKSISLDNLMFTGMTSYSLQTVADGADSNLVTMNGGGCASTGILSFVDSSNYVIVSPINCSQNSQNYIELKGDQVCPD